MRDPGKIMSCFLIMSMSVPTLGREVQSKQKTGNLLKPNNSAQLWEGEVYCHVFTRLNETCLITDCIDERDEHDKESHPLRKH